MILYCAIWNYTASCKMMLCPMKLYCVLWHCSIWNHKTRYNFIRPNTNSYYPMWNSNWIIFHRWNIKSYCAVWITRNHKNHKAQHQLIRRIITNVQNICSSCDWSRRVRYWPYCTLGLNIVLFDKDSTWVPSQEKFIEKLWFLLKHCLPRNIERTGTSLSLMRKWLIDVSNIQQQSINETEQSLRVWFAVILMNEMEIT